jgi:hypothetical protein
VIYYVDPPKPRVIIDADLVINGECTIGDKLCCRLDLIVPADAPETLCHVRTGDGWLVVGKTKFMVRGSRSVEFVLVPLKAGFLPYPQILLEGEDVECRERKCAGQVLVLPREMSKRFRVLVGR